MNTYTFTTDDASLAARIMAIMQEGSTVNPWKSLRDKAIAIIKDNKDSLTSAKIPAIKLVLDESRKSENHDMFKANGQIIFRGVNQEGMGLAECKRLVEMWMKEFGLK